MEDGQTNVTERCFSCGIKTTATVDRIFYENYKPNIICDICEEEIDYHSGWIYATGHRNLNDRLTKLWDICSEWDEFNLKCRICKLQAVMDDLKESPVQGIPVVDVSQWVSDRHPQRTENVHLQVNTTEIVSRLDDLSAQVENLAKNMVIIVTEKNENDESKNNLKEFMFIHEEMKEGFKKYVELKERINTIIEYFIIQETTDNEEDEILSYKKEDLLNGIERLVLKPQSLPVPVNAIIEEIMKIIDIKRQYKIILAIKQNFNDEKAEAEVKLKKYSHKSEIERILNGYKEYRQNRGK